MGTQRFPLSSTNPAPIFPSGLQGSVSLLNNGSKPCYVSDVASDIAGYPMPSGAAMQWKANRPLYARVDSGETTELLVNDAGDVLPFSAVTVAGGSLSTSDLANVATLDATIAFPTDMLDVSALGSLVITSNTVGTTAPASFDVKVTFYADAAGLYTIGTDKFSFSTSNTQYLNNRCTIRIKGPYCKVTPQNVTQVSSGQIYVYGQKSVLPESFYTDGNGDNATNDLAWYPTNSVTLANGASHSWYPASYSGDSDFFLRVTTTGGTTWVLSLQDIAGSVTYYRETWRDSWSNDTTWQRRLYLPKRPLRINIANFGGANQTFVSFFTFQNPGG